MNLRLTPNARKEHFEIIHYSKEHFGVSTTMHFIEEIEHSFRLLSDNPYMGALELTLEDNPRNYRYVLIHPYKMIYYVDKFDETIYVVTFFNTWQQPDKLLEVIR